MVAVASAESLVFSLALVSLSAALMSRLGGCGLFLGLSLVDVVLVLLLLMCLLLVGLLVFFVGLAGLSVFSVFTFVMGSSGSFVDFLSLVASLNKGLIPRGGEAQTWSAMARARRPKRARSRRVRIFGM